MPSNFQGTSQVFRKVADIFYYVHYPIALKTFVHPALFLSRTEAVSVRRDSELIPFCSKLIYSVFFGTFHLDCANTTNLYMSNVSRIYRVLNLPPLQLCAQLGDGHSLAIVRKIPRQYVLK